MESRMADDTWPPPAAAFSPIDHSRPSSQAGPARSGISAGITAIQDQKEEPSLCPDQWARFADEGGKARFVELTLGGGL